MKSKTMSIEAFVSPGAKPGEGATYRVHTSDDNGASLDLECVPATELSRLREADAALRALGAMLEWRDNAPGYGHGAMGILHRVNRWEVYIQRSGTDLFTGKGQPCLPAAILAAHAALVASGELPPLDGEAVQR